MAKNKEKTMTETDKSETLDGQSNSEAVFDRNTFRELNRKMEAESYEPTQEELESFEKWEEKHMNNPEEMFSEDDLEPGEPEGDEPEGEKEEDESEENNEDEQEDSEDEEESELPEDSKDFEEDQVQTLQSVMKEVGAKNINELPEKIIGLKRALTGTSGKVGTKAKQAEERATQLENSLKSQQEFITDFMQGKPEAIKYAQEHLGFSGTPKALKSEENTSNEDDSEGYLDPLVGKELKEIKESLARREKAEQESYAKKTALQQAKFDIVNKASTLVEKYPDFYRPKSGSISELISTYMDNPDQPVDPRIQPILDTIEHGKVNGVYDLEIAHASRFYNNQAQAIIDAEKRGRQSLLKHKPNPTLSGKRNQGEKVQYKSISDHDIKSMETGAKEIPDEWYGSDGHIDIKKVPRRAWRALGFE